MSQKVEGQAASLLLGPRAEMERFLSHWYLCVPLECVQPQSHCRHSRLGEARWRRNMAVVSYVGHLKVDTATAK